ncbi:MAG: YncE family protein [Bryobacteraceae bacterium]
MLTRRSFIDHAVIAASACSAACGRRDRVAGFPGVAFIANSDGKAVAAVDLTAFAVVRHIGLAGNPTAVVADPRRPLVYVLVPETAELVLISGRALAVAGRIRLPAHGTAMCLAPDASSLWILCEEQKAVRINLETHRVEGQWSLPAKANSIDVAVPEGREVAAVAMAGALALIRPRSGRPERIQLGVDAARGTALDLGLVTFRKDGRSVMVADRESGELWVIDMATRKVVVRLALGLRPRHYCVKPDGGEVHLTGEGSDALVTVFPYLTEVRGTVLAGRSPGFVAVSPANQILVANPETNNVTIVNGRNQRVLAVAPTGKEPTAIAVTPDGAFALVLNRASGDISVLRLANLSARRPSAAPAAPALTMIPVGSRPVSAAIVAIG